MPLGIRMRVTTSSWIVSLGSPLATIRATAQVPRDEELCILLADGVDTYSRTVGIVADLVEPLARHDLQAAHVVEA